MIRHGWACGLVCFFAICCMTPVVQAQVIHDFQDGSFGPLNVSGDGRVTASSVIAGNDFAGDMAGSISTGPTQDNMNLFVPVMSLSGASLIQSLHANDTIEWEVELAEWSGDFNNNHVVFQSDLPAPLGGFNTLDGSAQGFYPSGITDQTYSYNYETEGSGEGRAILDALDPNHDGDISDGPATFFNLFIIQQVGDGQTSTFVYDDIRLVPEPASAAILLLGMGVCGGLVCGRFRQHYSSMNFEAQRSSGWAVVVACDTREPFGEG